ncbi:MAG: FABP family protein [Bdellovibrionaceae bacterium]|nr:FABP family protein [Bdellovibrionales bacterium]MCB9084142.1 FABP family protein [Pseudobdellovibrionaceae bacterium]
MLTHDEIISKLGPLARLAGVWEGESGHDTAPSDDRGTEVNHYFEKMTFEPFGPVDNHEQQLFGLRYSTVATRIGETEPFHEETGYWLWDAQAKQVMRCFLVPRGVSVIAGGTVEPTAREFTLTAKLGSPTYGICSNPFLDREFQTVAYILMVKVLDSGELLYEQDTQIKVKGKPDIFHHIDKNALRKTGLL